MEDYLETIFNLEKVSGKARASAIAEILKVSRPSVTGMLQALADRNLVNYQPYASITLTDEGRKIAASVAHRHSVLSDFFVRVLCVEEKESQAAACRMEHCISPIVMERLVGFISYMDNNPHGNCCWMADMAKSFREKDDA